MATVVVINMQDKPCNREIFEVNLENKEAVAMVVLSEEWEEGEAPGTSGPTSVCAPAWKRSSPGALPELQVLLLLVAPLSEWWSH